MNKDTIIFAICWALFFGVGVYLISQNYNYAIKEVSDLKDTIFAAFANFIGFIGLLFSSYIAFEIGIKLGREQETNKDVEDWR